MGKVVYIRILGFALTYFSLVGCATLGGDPILDSVSAPSVPFQCTNSDGVPGDVYDVPLCAALERSVTDANGYLAASKKFDKAHVAFGISQVLAVTSVLGFQVFDAHTDNVAVATLVGATATGARTGLKPAQQRDILFDGYRTMNCIVDRGAVFIGYTSYSQHIESRVKYAASLVNASKLRSTVLTQERDPKAQPLLLAIANLESKIDPAMSTAGFMRRSAYQVKEARRAAENLTVAQLRAERPNYGALINAIELAAKPIAIISDEGEDGGADREAAKSKSEGDLDELISDLNRVEAEMVGYQIQPGEDEFKAIMECVAAS